MLSKYGTKGEIGKDQEVIIILMIPNAVLIHHFIDFDLAAPLCAPTDRLLVVEQLPREGEGESLQKTCGLIAAFIIRRYDRANKRRELCGCLPILAGSALPFRMEDCTRFLAIRLAFQLAHSL